MRGAGRPGRGRRGEVADRVRALLGEPDAGWTPGGPPAAPVPAGSGEAGTARQRLRASALRWQPERRAVLAVGLAVAVAGVLTLWWVLSARPRDVAVHGSGASITPVASMSSAAGGPASVAAPSPTPSPSGSAGARVVVDVAGKVRRPGVYRLPSGARVIDALKVAGGALPGVSTTALNLAAPLRDGQQVVVGVPVPASAASVPGGADVPAGSADPGPVDLNTATLEQLQSLPGVGPVLAQHILDWRTQHGRFASIDQLNEVSGIGTVKFAALRPLVTCS